METIGCSGMTHSAAMAAEILPGKTLLECLNTDLVCDAINVAMREIFKQLAYGRSQTAFSEDGLPIGAGLEDLGKGLRSQVGTMFSTTRQGRALHGNGRRLCTFHGSGRERRGHRLQVREAWQDAGGYPPRRRVRTRPTRRISVSMAVMTGPPSISTPEKNKPDHTEIRRTSYMANDVKFEGKERRMAKIEKCLAEYGIASLEDARELCLSKGVDRRRDRKGRTAHRF